MPAYSLQLRLPVRSALAAVAAAACLLVAGCDESTEIAVYDAPKEPPGAREVPPFVQIVVDGGELPMPTAQAPDGGETPTTRPPVPTGPRVVADWLLPQGWSPIEPAPRPAAYAFNIAHPDADELTATVTVLPGMGGGMLPNLNRWRNQLGLAPINHPTEQPQHLVPLTRATVSPDNDTNAPGVLPAIVFDIATLAVPGNADAPPPQRTLAGIWVDPSRGVTWFFKLTGPAAVVADTAQAFDDFVASTRPADPDPQPTPQAEAERSAASAWGVGWGSGSAGRVEATKSSKAWAVSATTAAGPVSLKNQVTP
ncbi:MAG: hypothetical protein AAF823_10755, partial [Planctomycetota bacterium]